MNKVCTICKRRLDNVKDAFSTDCGGDCILCMASAGDPDCARTVEDLEFLRRSLEVEVFKLSKYLEVATYPLNPDIYVQRSIAHGLIQHYQDELKRLER